MLNIYFIALIIKGFFQDETEKHRHRKQGTGHVRQNTRQLLLMLFFGLL